VSGDVDGSDRDHLGSKENVHDEDVIERAGAVLDLALMNGTLAMRTHVDIDTIGGLKPLNGVLALANAIVTGMTLQLVAFPQEGYLEGSRL